MMKYVFILAFLCTSAYASIQSSGLGFDYENATPEERAVFMEKQSELMRNRLQKAMHKNLGYGTPIKLAGVKTSASSISVDIALEYKDKMSGHHKTRADMVNMFCPQYVKMPLADFNLKVLVDMKDIDGRGAGRFVLDQSGCADYLPEALRQNR